MIFRLATESDCAAVVQLVNDLIQELGGEKLEEVEASESARTIATESNLGFIAVAESRDQLVGVCTVSFQTAIRALGEYGIVKEMYVSPEFRSDGVGQDLIEFASNQLAASGMRLLELRTPPDGNRAEHFYRSNNFHQVGVRMRRLVEETQ